MTIKKLIKLLQQYPDNQEIHIFDLENGQTHDIVDVSPFDTDSPASPDNPVTIDFDITTESRG